MSTSKFPGFHNVYSMGNSFAQGAMRFSLVDATVDLDSVATTGILPEGPLEFEHSSGTRLYDLLGESAAALGLVSGRFVSVLTDAGVRGWRVHPVTLRGKDGVLIPGYGALLATGRSGPIDRRKTRIVRKDPAVPGGASTYAELGLLFEPSSWDGSDVFSPAGTSVVCVTERAKRAIEQAGLTNVSFKPLSEHQIMLHLQYPAHRAG